MDSILNSIKKLLGIEEMDTSFDPEIIIYINSVFVKLKQLGVGPATGFSIADKDKKWDDYLGPDEKVGDIQTYMYIKVRLIFDPPATSFAIEAMERMATESEWRIQVDRDVATS